MILQVMLFKDTGKLYYLFVFEVDHTNIGGHYNHHTGVFTSPSHCVYVFSWSIYCLAYGNVYSELVVNSSPVSEKYVVEFDVSNQLSSTDLAIIELNTGDAVYIRTTPNHAASGKVLSDPLFRSTYSGWKLIQKVQLLYKRFLKCYNVLDLFS